MQKLLAAAEKCQTTAPSGVQVAPYVPILYFGDLTAYERSDLRILTVALNPSNAEFPPSSPFLRFPNLNLSWASQPQSKRFSNLRLAYDAYFAIHPYLRWFGNLEQVLVGFKASFQKGALHTALHTDLMTPVATTPTWSKLSSPDQAALSATGVPLWHELIKVLRPDLMLVSVAKSHFAKISFPIAGTSSTSIVLGGKTKHPVNARTVLLPCGKQTDVIYTMPVQVPFGFLSHKEKRDIGPQLRDQLTNW